MVSQPGVSDEATICLERMCGAIYDDESQKIIGEKNQHAPFEHQTGAYRFSAMVGHRLNRRTEEGGVMVTKWSTDSVTKGIDFKTLFTNTGREIDYIDWVDAMNRCADWGAKYIDIYHRSGDEYTLSYLIEILSTDDEIDECVHCGARKRKDEQECWFCKS